MPAAPMTAPKVCVLVTAPTEAGVRRFLARYVKPAFGLRKNQWRMCYREHYALTLLSRPLRAGENPADLYGPHARSGALVLAALSASSPASGFEAARAWLKAQGFDPMAELAVNTANTENENIDQGALVVNFVNSHCPWRNDPIDDLDAYMAKNNKPFWA